MGYTNADAAIARIQQRIAGLQKHVASSTAVPVEGKSMTCAEILTFLQAALDKRAEVNAAWGAYLAAVEARRESDVEGKTIDLALRHWVQGTFGSTSPVATDFGYLPKKPRTKSVETKARAILLAEATRKARGTMGKRQRLKIKGSLPTPEGAPEGSG